MTYIVGYDLDRMRGLSQYWWFSVGQGWEVFDLLSKEVLGCRNWEGTPGI